MGVGIAVGGVVGEAVADKVGVGVGVGAIPPHAIPVITSAAINEISMGPFMSFTQRS